MLVFRFFILNVLALSVVAVDFVRYGAFTQTATYSIASQLGFFTSLGLNVSYLQIPNSTYGYNELLNGGYDILTGTIDNAVNLRFVSKKSVTVLGQLDGGPDLVIASIPQIKSILDLKGKSLMVDSPVSGYAYVLQKILSLFGLSLGNGDYSFQVVGSTIIRYQDLIRDSLPNGTSVYATILTYPFTAEGEYVANASKPTVLARASDFVQPFSSTAFTVAESSLGNATKRTVLTRILSSFYAANEFLANPNNKQCSISTIAKQLNVSMQVAEAEYTAATDPMTGETSSPGGNFTVNRQGLLNVIDVRNQFQGFANLTRGFDFVSAIQPGKGQLIDYSVRDEAVRINVTFESAC